MAKQDLSPLVLAAQRGDQQALSDLLEASYRDLYFYAYQTVKNEDLAADITQESCLEIISTISQLREPNAFVVWARRITYHQCTRFFRESKEVTVEANEEGETIFDQIPDENEGVLPEQVQLDKEFRATMQQLLDELPAQQRTALMLYYYEKLSVSQIAQIQDTTEGTVKSRLNYGRKAVKAKVEEYEKKTGLRLHSIAPLPLLFFLFGRQSAAAMASASLGSVPAVLSGSIAAGAGATAGTAATGAAAGTAAATGTAVTTGTATGTAAAAVGTGLGVKIAAGAVAAAVCIGGAVGGAALINNLSSPKVPAALVGTWYGDQYTDAHTEDVLIIDRDGTLDFHGYTFDLVRMEKDEEDSTGKDMDLYFVYETERPDCGTCTHTGVRLECTWLEDGEGSDTTFHEGPGYLISVRPLRGEHANGEEAVAPFYKDPADAYLLFHHYYQKEPRFRDDIWGEWALHVGDSADSFTLLPDHRFIYNGTTYTWKLSESYFQDASECYEWDGVTLLPAYRVYYFQIYSPTEGLPCCLHDTSDRQMYLELHAPGAANLDLRGGEGGSYYLGAVADTGPTVPDPTAATAKNGTVIPSQFLGNWESFPDEEYIVSYYQSREDGTLRIYDTAYYAVHSDATTVYLATDPETPPHLATARLVYHTDTFGIPAIEFQKLYPDDDKEPRTLDYFWRSADLQQTEAVTLNDSNWELFIDCTLRDQNGSTQVAVITDDLYTYFSFKTFVAEGSRAEGSVLRSSYLHRSYMIGNQGYNENIPGYEYPSDQMVGLGGDAGSVGVPRLPDGVTSGRAVSKEVDGETILYYEQFNPLAELNHVTGTVYIPAGFNAEAWLAANG